MKSVVILACLTFGMCCPVWTFAQVPARVTSKPNNAALQYWQAFSTMPTLDEKQKELLENWNTAPLDAKAQELINASSNSVMYLHRGAQIEVCDWGLDYDDGIGLLLPHVAKSRDLARLAALHARFEFERGNKKAARQDAVSMAALARHIGQEPIMICQLVQYLIEEATVDLVAPHVPELKASYADSLAMFDRLPKAATLQESVMTERDFFAKWMVNKIKAEEKRQKGAGLELWKQKISGIEIPESIKYVQYVDEILRMCDELAPKYGEMARLVTLPQPEFDEQYPMFYEAATASSPVAQVIFPAVNKVLAKQRHSQARMAMLL